MTKHLRPTSTTGLFLAAVSATLSLPFSLQAAPANDPTKYECNLHGSVFGQFAGCVNNGTGGGTSTVVSAVRNTVDCRGTVPTVFGSNFCGANSPAGASAVLPIYAWNICRWVDNTGANNLFVPVGTPDEWQAFKDRAPSGVSLTTCAVPYSANGAPAQTNLMATGGTTAIPLTTNYTNCSPYNVDNPNVYGRTSTSFYPASTVTVGSPGIGTLSCNSGFTTMMARYRWQAGTLPDTPSTNLSWNPQFTYSPDVDLTTTTPVISFSGAGGSTTATVDWNISPFQTGAARSCSVSTGGLGSWQSSLPPAAGSGAASGSSTVSVVEGSNTFYLTCSSDSPALTSVARVTITADNTYVPPPPCGFCGGG
jgi:hypothetical protein